jgi:hypothetical protein
MMAAVLAVMLGSCASQAKLPTQAAQAAVSVQAARTASDMEILDWKSRGLGEIASPEWLLPAVRGDWSAFRRSWNVGEGKVLKVGIAQGPSLNAAQTIADVQYAARLAGELKQTVLTRAAISLGSDGEFDVVNDAATKTLVSIAGQERLTDFWQKIETSGEKGKKTVVYNYYVVYACDEAVWSQLVAKYLFDVVGLLPEKKTQQTMAAMFTEIDAETKAAPPKSETEFRAALDAQQTALASGGVPKDQQRAAYRSGDPAKAAAASATPADTNYITALALIAQQ